MDSFSVLHSPIGAHENGPGTCTLYSEVNDDQIYFGHYSRLYKKNTKKNKYWIVRFTDSDGRHRELLLHQIDPALENTGAKSFVITQPQIVKYENFKHPYPYEQFRVHKDDRKKRGRTSFKVRPCQFKKELE